MENVAQTSCLQAGGLRYVFHPYGQFSPTPGTVNVGFVLAEIFEIQGTALTSPLVNKSVITENNVVTALASNGFAMQTPDARADADVKTSSGIFVFTGRAPAVAHFLPVRPPLAGKTMRLAYETIRDALRQACGARKGEPG